MTDIEAPTTPPTDSESEPDSAPPKVGIIHIIQDSDGITDTITATITDAITESDGITDTIEAHKKKVAAFWKELNTGPSFSSRSVKKNSKKNFNKKNSNCLASVPQCDCLRCRFDR